MGILGYQLVIFVGIILFSFGGLGWWSIAIVIAIAWTITQIFMPWLMALQLVTIFIAGAVGYKIADFVSKIRTRKRKRR